ncbi:MAG: hypothetical protein H0W29_14870 [Gemmatimonadales bacterium]|nr:hypothetical protein [Gemmatimonadales bacterium]
MTRHCGSCILLVVSLVACATPGRRPVSPPPPGPALASAESLYLHLRTLRDRIDVATAGGRHAEELVPRHNALQAQLGSRLAAIDSSALAGDDARALGFMRRTLARDLTLLAPPAAADRNASSQPPDCAYDAVAIAAAPNGLDSLRGRLYACYGWAQSHVVVGSDTLDRLSILGSLGRTDDARRRRQLFLALGPVWRSMNGDDRGGSPYRRLIALEVKERRGADPPAAAQARAGGLDNLNELLHETGHAAHIAAIRTRPAFTDWPDSDPFTEAVADFVALDVYEPVWQQRWLGDSVPLADGLRARYGGIVLDVAWALLEARMQRDPAADPNVVWTRLTHDYLRIRPHPELSWWAMRGQLVDAPGYMMNYAAGAILIAAIRARTREVHGPFATGDSTWYRWIAPRLLRFGLEQPTREVIERFLGGPVSPAALLADMSRMRR